MSQTNYHRRFVASVTAMVMLAAACLGWANSPEPAADVQARLDALLTAVQANDHAGFVAQGTVEFKTSLTAEMVQAIHTHLSQRMNNGYQTHYLGSLAKQGHEVYLWKISFTDGGDDILAKLVLKDVQTAGFWLE